ncbi:phage tail spike protein [Halalkalibacter sp. APA_J-10(15)]|uniref:phage tail spike protein n=1 Tax=Halalkalibacter sp. APA_J-10(15) TaxID=2933805 RepID=UPI0027955EB4|nr:phage tail spike protein [Halalkalibacter sp. APA_J-10(15)]MCK0471389.1 phage tail protein [Halalkalibacter sp. APA_J-10(15)]
MSDLMIFDVNDNLLAVLSNEGETSCPFWDAPFKEELNRGSTFEFSVPADHPDAFHVEEENQVAFKDKDGFFRLFFIRETDSIDGSDGAEIRAYCESAFMELDDEPIEDRRPQNTTSLNALTVALENTRWIVGTVASLGNRSTNFYYESVKSAIEKIINTWGGELRDRIEINGNQITGRFVDLLSRRGADTGKRWEIDKDIIAINRNGKSYPKTALYGRGKSLETEGGGFSRKITFADVVWSVANGDPVDKPAGQEWVGDPGARDIYGYPNPNGSRRHRFGFYENGEQEDPEVLLQQTWDALQQAKLQFANYSIDGVLLGDIEGYEFESVRLGDTNIAIDRNFAKPIEVELRIIVYEYDVANPDDVGKVEMGQFIELYIEDRELQDIKAKIDNKEGIWDRAGEPIDGNDLPDIIPDVPTLTAEGLFQTVKLEWTFQNELYVADYEVYGSQVSTFTPGPSNLLFRGKTSGFIHSVDTNQQWYYRVRGVNTHGNASAYSNRASAETQRILTDEIMFGAITTDLLADLAVDAEKLANSAVTATKIANLAVGTAAIENGAITNAKIGNLAVDTAQIQNGAITNAKIGNLSADKITTGTLSAIDITGVNITGSTITSVSGNNSVVMTAGGVITTGVDGGLVSTTNMSAGRYFVESEIVEGSYERISLGGFGPSFMRYYNTQANFNANRPESSLRFTSGGSTHGPMLSLVKYDDNVGLTEVIGRLRISYPDGGNPIIAALDGDGDGITLELSIDSDEINISGGIAVGGSITMNASGSTRWIDLGNGNRHSTFSDYNTLYCYSNSGSRGVAIRNPNDQGYLMLWENSGFWRVNRDWISTTSSSANMRIFTSDTAEFSRIALVSSRRDLKRDINPLEITEEQLMSLNPITFLDKAEYEEKGEEANTQIGLIAEDVFDVLPILAELGEDGEPVSVRYDRIGVALLPSFIRLLQRVGELESKLEEETTNER